MKILAFLFSVMYFVAIMTDNTSNKDKFEAQLDLAKSFKAAAQHVTDGVRQQYQNNFFITANYSHIDSFGSQLIREAVEKLQTERNSTKLNLKNSIELVSRRLISEFTDIVMTDKDAENITKRYNRKIRDELYIVSEGSRLIGPEIRQAKGLGYKPPALPQ